MTQLVVLPVLLPLLGAGVCLVLGRSARAQRVVSIVVLSAVVATAATLLVRADDLGPQSLTLAVSATDESPPNGPRTIGVSIPRSVCRSPATLPTLPMRGTTKGPHPEVEPLAVSDLRRER